MSSNTNDQEESTITSTVTSIMPIVLSVLVSLALFAISLISFVKHQFTLDAYSTIVLLVAAFLISASTLFKWFSKLEIGLGGIKAEARELKDSINTLSMQVKALGQLAVFEQVSAANRLAIERPELTKVWKGMDTFTDDQLRQVFYIYCFLDAFEVMLQFKRGTLLSEETYELWQKQWVSELLDSEAGKLMREKRLLDYYSDELKKECGIPLKS